MKQTILPFFQIGLCTCTYISATSDITLAQVTSDNTVNTKVNQNGRVAEITGGTTRGDNLFHSFREFSVRTGNEAFFNNATDISNIFSRVTGGKISNIDGLIRANGDASLFLINPTGIIFGKGARLDIGGSFYGSSASSILFEDGEFSAADLENPPLLTVNAPIGLGFRDNPGDIVNRASTGDGLEVSEGQNISLIGGNVRVEEGGRIFTPGGKIELGGLTTAGKINIAEDNTLSFPDGVARGDVSLSNNASLITFSLETPNGGDINLTANSVSANNNVNLFTSQLNQFRGGNVNIDATNKVSFANNSDVAVAAQEGGSIFVSAKNLTITSGSSFSAGITPDVNSLELEAGNIIINVAEDVFIDGEDNPDADQKTGIFSQNLGGIGNTGNIEIKARNIFLRNGGTLSNGNQGQGNSGDIIVNASERVDFDGFENNERGAVSGIQSLVFPGSTGNTGDVFINTKNLSLSNGAVISSFVLGNGNSGNINIDATESTTIEGIAVRDRGNSATSITTKVFGTGNSGDVNIVTPNLSLLNSGEISSEIFGGKGNAGDINISSENLVLDGQGNEFASPSSIRSDISSIPSESNLVDENPVNRIAEGNGGEITVNTNFLSITNGADISATNFGGIGDSGTITINAVNEILVDGTATLTIEEETQEVVSGISASSFNVDTEDFRSVAVGNAGTVEINTAKFTVSNGAEIAAFIRGEGNAGSIIINADEFVRVLGTSFIATGVQEGTGTGGNLEINTKQLSVRDGSTISVSTFADGNAGTLTVNASESIELTGKSEFSNSGLFASALDGNGNGGNINVSTKELSIIDNALIGASNFSSFGTFDPEQAGTGQPGSINVEANSISLNTGGRIEAATQSAIGEGANIDLRVAEDITLKNNSFISARAINQGNGGNLNIDSRFIIAYPEGNNDILASAEQGRGGNITIDAESLFGIRERTPSDLTNDINASSEVRGLDGTVDIITPDVNPLQGATELPTNIVVPEQTTTQACQANREAAASNGLTIKGKGGVPPAPHLPLNSHNITINGENTDSTASIPQPIETSQGKIQPARGITVTKDGRVILTAYRTNNQGDRLPPESINCDRV